MFGFDSYYPSGGFGDYLGDYDDLLEIEGKIDSYMGMFTFNGYCRSNYQIFDCFDRVLVQAVNPVGFLEVH